MEPVPILFSISSWALIAVTVMLATLHAVRLVLQLLILMVREAKGSVSEIRGLVVQLWNGVSVPVDTSDAESVGRLISTLRDTDAPPDQQRERPHQHGTPHE